MGSWVHPSGLVETKRPLGPLYDARSRVKPGLCESYWLAESRMLVQKKKQASQTMYLCSGGYILNDLG